MARTCRWCGRTYEDSIYWGCCSEKCYLESEGRDPASQAQEEMRANLAKARKQMEREHAELEATLKRERADRERERTREAERREAERKRDPKNWYGSEWAEHLSKHPEDAFQCDWGKLRGADCALLFSMHPEFAEKVVDWQSRMNGDDWEKLLCSQPCFADDCNWKSLSRINIRKLLEKRPQFADKCDLGILKPVGWARLLRRQPQFAPKCTAWDDIDAEEWMELLKKQPSFIVKCNWAKFAKMGTDTCTPTAALRSILESHPDLVDKCDLSILSGGSWSRLLVTCPQFADRFSEWDSLDADHRVLLLEKQPQFADKFKTLECISVDQWVDLIEKQPQLIKKCDVSDRFSWQDWVRLAPLSQETAESCVWTSFLECSESKKALKRLLIEHPELEQKRDAEFSFLRQYVDVDAFPNSCGDAWLTAAKNRPRIAWAACRNVFCSRTPGCNTELKEWFKAFPFLVSQFDWQEAGKDWLNHKRSVFLPILSHESELCRFLPYLKQMGEAFFRGADDLEWESFLSVDPSLVRWHPNRDDMKIDWVAVVRADATALSDCDSKRFTVDDWLSILKAQPSIFDKCDKVNDFTAEQWAKLLNAQPQLTNVCPITKFSSSELEGLFKKCNWEALEQIDWEYINSLSIEERIKLTLIEWHAGARIPFTKSEIESDVVRKMPADEMAKLCNYSPSAREWFDESAFDWAGLSAAGWVNLLWELPQYKDKCDVTKFDWSTLGRSLMLGALCYCPEGIVAYYNDWESVSHDEWVELVKHQPILKSYMKKYDKGKKDAKGDEGDKSANGGCQLGCLGKLIKLAIWCAVIWYGLSVGVSFVDYSKFEVPEKARVVLNRMSNDGMKVREWVLGLIVRAQEMKEDESEK